MAYFLHHVFIKDVGMLILVIIFINKAPRYQKIL